jgi:hypothetical protein
MRDTDESEQFPNTPPDWTPDTLKSYPGLEHLTDEQAAEAMQTLEQLAAIFFEVHCFKDGTCIDNQHVVYSLEQKQAA